jgi:hypothetical protein
LRAAEIIKK